MPAETIIQVRRGTASQWTNQVLATGEIGFETDTLKFKIGDGTTAWGSLAYAKAGSADTATSASTATSATSASSATNATNAQKGAIYGSGYAKITVKAGSTGPTSPSEGDVWISF